jgi:hypothetical protein
MAVVGVLLEYAAGQAWIKHGTGVGSDLIDANLFWNKGVTAVFRPLASLIRNTSFLSETFIIMYTYVQTIARPVQRC